MTHKNIRDQKADPHKNREEGAGTFPYPPSIIWCRYKTVIVLNIKPYYKSIDFLHAGKVIGKRCEDVASLKEKNQQA